MIFDGHTGSFPSRCRVAISQADAALTSTLLPGL